MSFALLQVNASAESAVGRNMQLIQLKLLETAL